MAVADAAVPAGAARQTPVATPSGPARVPREPVAAPPPATPAAPAAEPVAQPAAADLSGPPEQAAVALLSAPPSAMAVALPTAGPRLMAGFGAAVGAAAARPPVLTAQTSGAAVPAAAPPVPLPYPVAGAAARVEAARPPDPAPLRETVPSLPQGAFPNAGRVAQLAQGGGGGDSDGGSGGGLWARFRSWLSGLISGIATTDPGLHTRAGTTPAVARDGAADPARVRRQAGEADGAVSRQANETEAALRIHPGQRQVQPQAHRSREEARPQVSPQTVPSLADAGAAAYAAAPLPEAVRVGTDAALRARMAPRLAAQRERIGTAASARDTQAAAARQSAEAGVQAAQARAENRQRAAVAQGRARIAAAQSDGIARARSASAAFRQASGAERARVARQVDTTARQAETQAQTTLARGESEAATEKRRGEREARQLKAGLAAQTRGESWWRRARSAITSAVARVTRAIDTVFTRVRRSIAGLIARARRAAVGLINRARSAIVGAIDRFRDWAQRQVARYVGAVFPGLARAINATIGRLASLAQAAVSAVANGLGAVVRQLARRLAGALSAVLRGFQVAVTGALQVAAAVMTGDFAGALQLAVIMACRLAGVDPAPVLAFFARAGAAVGAILRAPGRFIGQLMRAVGRGVRNFLENLRRHLIGGVVGWLTGALGAAGLQGPFRFTPAGIARIGLQLLGLTYANIRARVIRRVPRAASVFDRVERAAAFMRDIVTRGPAAIWAQIRARVGDLKAMVMGAITRFLASRVIRQGLLWLLSLLNPAAAIVRAVKAIYDLVMVVIERLAQLRDFVARLYSAVAAILAQNFVAVTHSVEQVLARSIPLLISTLAGLLGLGGISQRVAALIRRVSAPVNRAVDWLVGRIVAIARRVVRGLRRGVQKAKAGARRVVSALMWWKRREPFRSRSGAAHTLTYTGTARRAQLVVATTPTPIEPFLAERKTRAKNGATFSTDDVKDAQVWYEKNVKDLETDLETADAGTGPQKRARLADANASLVNRLYQNMRTLGTRYLARLFDPGEAAVPPPRLPPMADNSPARSFDADFVVRRHGHTSKGFTRFVPTGSESSAHKGFLRGWRELQTATLTTGGKKYVRMHLLPHLIGGDAADSNLVPARGDRANTPFSHAVEQPAIRAAGWEDRSKPPPPIWYKVKVSYFPASLPPPPGWTAGPYPSEFFPKRIAAAWGYYRDRGKTGGRLERGATQGSRSFNPAKPSVNTAPPAINTDGVTALSRALDDSSPSTSSTRHFVTTYLVPEARKRNFADRSDLVSRLWAAQAPGADTGNHRRLVHIVFTALQKRRDPASPETFVTLN